MNIQDLPDIVLEKIFSYLTYNQIAENRIVSRKFNEIGSEMLSRGYYMVERFHRKSIKSVKAKLPRRESERKTHPLSRQCDILVAVETRLSMLSMTFTRYIEAKQCCFIPGKVIDELLRVLRFVNTFVTPPHDILQELRDITSMAMEHFDEKIAPNLKDRLAAYRASSNASIIDNAGSNPLSLQSNLVTFKNLFSVVRQTIMNTKSNRNHITAMSLKSKKIVKRTRHNSKVIKLLKNKVTEQSKEILKLRRVIQNWEAKFRDLSAEVRGLSRHGGLDTFPLTGENMEDVSNSTTDSKMSKKRKLKKD